MTSFLKSFSSSTKTTPVQDLGAAVMSTFDVTHQGQRHTQCNEVTDLTQVISDVRENQGKAKGLNQQIEIAKAADEQLYKKTMQALSSPGYLHIKFFTAVRFEARSSACDKLSGFVQTHLSLINAVKKLRDTRPSQYHKAMEALADKAGKPIAKAAAELAKLDLDNIDEDPISPSYSAAAQSLEDSFEEVEKDKEEKEAEPMKPTFSEGYINAPAYTTGILGGRNPIPNAAHNAIDNEML